MRKLYLNFQSQDSQHIECLVLCISTGWNFSLIISSCQPHVIHIRVCTIRRRRWMSNFISFISAAIVPNHLVFTNYASSSLPHTNNASSSLPHTNKPVVDMYLSKLNNPGLFHSRQQCSIPSHSGDQTHDLALGRYANYLTKSPNH